MDDAFFTHNIYIVGLSLSFVEIDLWWLLDYRAQFFIDKQLREHVDVSELPIIRYYYPARDEHELSDQLVMFGALGVEPRPFAIRGQRWNKYYKDVIADIGRSISP